MEFVESHLKLIHIHKMVLKSRYEINRIFLDSLESLLNLVEESEIFDLSTLSSAYEGQISLPSK